MSNSKINSYLPQSSGLGGLWYSGTGAASNAMTSLGNLPDKFQGWGDWLVIGGVIVVGGVLLMIAYSFASGKQNMGDIAAIVKAVK